MKRVSTRLKKGRFSIPFDKLKNKVLGKSFELSLVFVDNVFSRRLNKIYRKKNKPANILSFPLSKKSGEIFIDLVTAKKDSKKFEMSFRNFVEFLFVHGLLHLKGMRHGDTMDEAEKKLLHGTTNLGRNRHRNF